MVELLVLVGAPGAGKSHWAQKMSEREGYSWVSSDNIRKNYGYDISNAEIFDQENPYWADFFKDRSGNGTQN